MATEKFMCLREKISQFPLNAILTRNVRFCIRLYPLPFMVRFDAAFFLGTNVNADQDFSFGDPTQSKIDKSYEIG